MPTRQEISEVSPDYRDYLIMRARLELGESPLAIQKDLLHYE